MITNKQVCTIVKEFKLLNADERGKERLTQGQKSQIYQLLIDDYKLRTFKSTPGTHSEQKEFVSSAEYTFGSIGRRKKVLWPCKMVNTKSSFIRSIGYCNTEHILKIVTQSANGTIYAFAYCDVPKIRYTKFLSAKDKGVYYNRNIKGKYDCLALV